MKPMKQNKTNPKIYSVTKAKNANLEFQVPASVPFKTEQCCLFLHRYSLEFEQFAEAFGLGAADRDFGVFSVVHFEDVGGLEPRHDFLDVMDVDEEGAVGAEERFGGQGFFEFVDGAEVG